MRRSVRLGQWKLGFSPGHAELQTPPGWPGRGYPAGRWGQEFTRGLGGDVFQQHLEARLSNLILH